jgi:hypothetical protein
MARSGSGADAAGKVAAECDLLNTSSPMDAEELATSLSTALGTNDKVCFDNITTNNNLSDTELTSIFSSTDEALYSDILSSPLSSPSTYDDNYYNHEAELIF